MTKNTFDAFTTPADPELAALVADALDTYRAWQVSEDELEARLRFRARIREGVNDLSAWIAERTGVESR